MNFTPGNKVGPILGGILTIVVAGLIGWSSHVAPVTIPAAQNTSILPAVEITAAHGPYTPKSDYYQPVSSWYKSQHWWKRNAPIVGGAGGGALVGGLVGGGTGAIIGGVAGGGGGYLYKRSRHHHGHNYHHGHY